MFSLHFQAFSSKERREIESETERASEKAIVVNLQISVLSLWTKPRGRGRRMEKTESRERKCDMGGELKEQERKQESTQNGG